MGMMAQIATSLEETKYLFRTVFSTLSSKTPTHHATRRCSQHLNHLAHPRRSVVLHHPTAAITTTTPYARTTPPVILPTMQTANTTTTTTPRSTSLSLLRPTPHILAKPTALTSDEDNLVVDVLTDDMDVAMVEVRRQAEDEVTITLLNGPEMVST